MTDDELKERVASLAVSNKELRDSQKETDKGDIAATFFYNSLIKDNHLGHLRFDDVTRNMEKHQGQIQEEYDIFLTNDDTIAIIDVKYKAHLKDIKK